MCKSVRERGIKVVLQGDGGDELLVDIDVINCYLLILFSLRSLSLSSVHFQISRVLQRISRLALALSNSMMTCV